MEVLSINKVVEIVEQVKKGKKDAFWELMSEYEEAIFRFCYRKLFRKEIAEDVAREAFVKAYEKINSLKDNSKFKSWLYKIAYNACMDEIKRVNRIVDSEDNPHDNISDEKLSPEHLTEQKRNKEVIKKEFKKLSDNHKDVIILVYYEGLSYEEAAEVLGISVGTVKSRLFRALEVLRKNLNDIV